MKRKILASLMCLLMMATLLPVGSMAEVTTETPILSNGDFENGLEGWSKNGSADAVIIDSSDTPAEGVNPVSPLEGSALKLAGKADYYQPLTGLEEGKQYIVQGYVNAPVRNDAARVFIGRGAYSPASGSYATSIYNIYTFGEDETPVTTNGWQRFTVVFKYDTSLNQPTVSDVPNTDTNWYFVFRNVNDAGAAIYFDEVTVRDFDESMQEKYSEKVLVYETFEAFTTDYKMTPSYSNSAFDPSSSPKGEGVILDGDGAWYTKTNPSVNQLTLSTSSLFNTICSDGDMLHLRFRAKNQEGTESEIPAVGFQYNNAWGSPRTIESINTALNNGDWVNYDFWFPYDSSIWNKLVICVGVNDGWFLDDLVLSVASDTFVGTGKTLETAEKSFKMQSDAAKTFIAKKRSSAEIPFTSSETAIPYIYVSTTETSKSALALSAVYKNEGSKRQLLNVITEKLDATASAAAYSTGSIDLSTLGLTAADGVTYTVETYLWDDGSIKPMTKKVSSPITVAAATE